MEELWTLQEPLYIYYKLFDENGPTNSRHPIYSNAPSIGRVDANLIPPPHNVSSLVQFICGREEKRFGIDWENGDAFSTQLFKTISSPKPFDLNEHLPLLSDERPGLRPQEPLVLKVGYEDLGYGSL